MTTPYGSSASERDYFLDTPHHQRLYLIYTLKCNYACKHCFVSSGPDRTEKMLERDAEVIIESAAACGYRVIYLTGGEVMLYYKEILRLIKKISDLGMHSILETNGSWAIDDRRTKRRMAQLIEAGCDCIAISMDSYHEPFGGIEYCIRIHEHATRHDLPCRILVVASEDVGSDDRILSELRQRGIPYFYEELLSVGRGDTISNDAVLLQTKRCDSIGATVLTNGDIISCAGALRGSHARRDLPLYSGNLIREDARTVLRRDQKNVIARAIEQKGHQFLIDNLDEELLARVPQNCSDKSICDFCHKFLSDKPIVQSLREKLRSQASF
ncbi:radical SAM protein [Parerythrobacter aestuarii]|uniref:radical SAM protein n=1 Tax=Parerythrobacter aestuarii TaxID=3020909 RepID=UPI0024DEA873|nr:radical SAM protein [Parerythrobacter aestuarii]